MVFLTEELAIKFVMEDESSLGKMLDPIEHVSACPVAGDDKAMAVTVTKHYSAENFIFDDYTINGADESIRTQDFQKFMIRECGVAYARCLLKREDKRHKVAIQEIKEMCVENSIEL